MSDLADAAVASAVTIVPFYLGLLTFKIPAIRNRPQMMVAFALGASFLFFLDPIRDTNGLGGFSPTVGPEQVILLTAFVATFVLLALGKGRRDPWPILIIATGIAIHSFAEASELTGAVPNYLSNFSVGMAGATSFVLHKLIEGTVLAAFCVTAGIRSVKGAALGAAPMVAVSVAGALSGLLSYVNLTTVLAAGAGGWMFVTIVLGMELGPKQPPKIFALVALGFAIVYSVGLLHSS